MKQALIGVANHADDNGDCFSSIGALADDVGRDAPRDRPESLVRRLAERRHQLLPSPRQRLASPYCLNAQHWGGGFLGGPSRGSSG
jgi:hypothetical protein